MNWKDTVLPSVNLQSEEEAESPQVPGEVGREVTEPGSRECNTLPALPSVLAEVNLMKCLGVGRFGKDVFSLSCSGRQSQSPKDF